MTGASPSHLEQFNQWLLLYPPLEEEVPTTEVLHSAHCPPHLGGKSLCDGYLASDPSRYQFLLLHKNVVATTAADT